MARLTASQISLMKQFFAQIGSVDSSWIIGDIPLDQVSGTGNWFTESFDTRLLAQAPTIVTDQATAAVAAAANAQATADAALAAIDALTFISGHVYKTSTVQTISSGTPVDVDDLTTDITVDSSTTFMVTATVDAELNTAGDGAKIYLNVDGVNEALHAVGQSAGVSTMPLTQTWRLTLAAGTHTIKVQAIKTVSDIKINQYRASLSWWQV